MTDTVRTLAPPPRSTVHARAIGEAAAGTLRRPFPDGFAADGFPADEPPIGGSTARQRANRNRRPRTERTATMASTNRTRVDQCLETLRRGLAPFIERELRRAVGTRRLDAEAIRTVTANARQGNAPLAQWDAAALLRTMWDLWNPVFRSVLGFGERSLVAELRNHRNDWAHQEPFSGDDAHRAVDSACRLLPALDAGELEALTEDPRAVRWPRLHCPEAADATARTSEMTVAVNLSLSYRRWTNSRTKSTIHDSMDRRP